MDPGLIRHTTASHASRASSRAEKALIGKEDPNDDGWTQPWKNVLEGGSDDAVTGARPALRYGTRSTVRAARWRMVTTLTYNLSSCEIVATADHETSWRATVG